MKKVSVLALAAVVLIAGSATCGFAEEPARGFGEKKELVERNRRRGHRRGRGGVWFSYGGGYHRPYPGSYYGYYYAPPPPTTYYYYAVPAQPYCAPVQPYYGGTVIVR
ncbi:MAG: hypothetical protein LBJ46_08420 [Planctomycetota bacterium]|nr:hypothetical protein [Planctomycetota bacterium]